MKKLFLLANAILTVGTLQLSAASISQCILHHQGTVTMYDGGKLSTAMTASADGDTLFLTSGNFDGFTITKKITVRGAGEGTIIGGDVTVNIPNKPTLDNVLLEGVKMTGSLYVKAAVDNMTIKQCHIGTNVSFSANVNDAVFDRCYIGRNFRPSSYTKGVSVLNSYIYAISQDSKPASDSNILFVNCYVNEYCDNYYLSFINSIIGGGYSYYTLYSCSITNCYYNTYRSYYDNCTMQDCWSASITYYITEPSIEDLEQMQYFGTDGTVIGRYGGSTPYTLELDVPKVTSKTISYDVESKSLNVTLSVSPN